MADVKKSLARSEKIPSERQRLLLGDSDVDDLQAVAELAPFGALNLAA